MYSAVPRREARVPDVVIAVHREIGHAPRCTPGIVDAGAVVFVARRIVPGPSKDAVEPSPGFVPLRRVRDVLALVDQVPEEEHVIRVVREHGFTERAGHVRVRDGFHRREPRGAPPQLAVGEVRGELRVRDDGDTNGRKITGALRSVAPVERGPLARRPREAERQPLAIEDRGRPNQEDEPCLDTTLDAARLSTGRRRLYFLRGHRVERRLGRIQVTRRPRAGQRVNYFGVALDTTTLFLAFF